jgi:hypothetical protein
MLRSSLLRGGRSVFAALTLTALTASPTPISAQGPESGAFRLSLETAGTSWTASANSRLSMRVSAANLDLHGPTNASVTIGLPRSVQDLRVLAPPGWSCGYDDVTDETVRMLCTTEALQPGETAQIFVNGRAPAYGGMFAIWSSGRNGVGATAERGAAESITSSAVLSVSGPPSPPPPPTPVGPRPGRSVGCPGGMCP